MCHIGRNVPPSERWCIKGGSNTRVTPRAKSFGCLETNSQDGKEKNFSDIHKETSRTGDWDKAQEVLAGKIGFSCVCIISLCLCFFPTSQQFQWRSLNMENNALEAFKVLGHGWEEK